MSDDTAGQLGQDDEDIHEEETPAERDEHEAEHAAGDTPALPNWARVPEYEVTSNSPRGDKSGMQINEPLYIFEKIRELLPGEEMHIKRLR